MKTAPLRREFSFRGLKLLPDPNPQMNVEDVRGVLAMQYPEIRNRGNHWAGGRWRRADTFERTIGSTG